MNKDVTDLNTIKQWFKTGSKPTQEQFWAWMDSFFHKEETIPQDQIEDLATTLENKADANGSNIDTKKYYEAIKKHIPASGGIDDAPNDGKLYARKNGVWVELPSQGVKPLSELLKGKTASFIGDSISTFGDGSESHYLSTGMTKDGLVSDITTQDDTWWGVFLNKTGGTLKIADGFSGTYVSGEWVGNWAVNRATWKDHTADYIFILMGTNDVNNPSTIFGDIKAKGSFGDVSNKKNPNYLEFTSAYQIGLEKMIAKYPNSKIIPLTLVPAFNNKGSERPRNGRIPQFNERIKELAKLYNLDYIDLAKVNITATNNAEYLLDGLHPNKAGMELIGNYLAEKASELLNK